MFDRDLDQFVGLLSDVFGMYPNAKPLTEGQVAMFFRALDGCTLAEVRAGLDAHVRDTQRGRFPPLPADVLAQIEGIAKDDGRPGPEEAWAIASAASNEAATVVWTQEIAQAWSVSRPVADAGDDVGARMAFKEAYTRLVNHARDVRAPVTWQPSYGHDPELRAISVSRAITDGRLPAAMAIEYKPRADVMLLGMAPSDGDSLDKAAALQALRRLRERIGSPNQGPSQADIEREHTEALKAEAQRKVDQAMRREA